MQIYIAKTLNKVLLLFSAVIVVLFAGIFIASRYYPEYARWQVLVFVVASVFLALFYKYLEENWEEFVWFSLHFPNIPAVTTLFWKGSCPIFLTLRFPVEL